MNFLIQLSNKFQSKSSASSMTAEVAVEKGGYGTFYGVFLPSILSIFGVIMYLRLGMILGKLGLIPTLSIVVLSSLITFLTSLSISSISTNMKVEKGGAYYMISRSLGIDFGTALGIPIYLAQAIGIAFYILGFSETICASFPGLDVTYIALVTLLTLGILGFFSTTIVLKTQFFIFLIIVASLISIFFGNPVPYSMIDPIQKMGYWAGFAIFFPAVTGIFSGVSMSGDLKKPRKSLPLGTIGAVLTGLVVYILLVLVLWARVPRQLLVQDTMICEHIARYGSLIILGIWGATLSSALGSILGAPRTLQALAEDGIVFKFLGKEQGKKKEPRIASLFTIGLTGCFLFFGKIDTIAPILTMFFLISYCILNLVAGIETLMHNPSWRPSFNVKPWVYFAGALLCLIAMFMINAGATFISLLIVLTIYFFRGKKLNSNWDDICFAILMQVTKSTVYRLKNSSYAARCWRPHLLVLSPSVTLHKPLVEFVRGITGGNSFITFAHLMKRDTRYNDDTITKSIANSLKKQKMQAFVKVETVGEIEEGYKRLIVSHGIGPLTHNTVLLNHHEANPEVIETAYKAGKNTIVLKEALDENKKDYQIDIWWDSINRKTSELMLVLAHMFQTNIGTKHSHLTLKSIVNSETAREQRLEYFHDFFSNSRLHVDFKVYVSSLEEELKTMNFFSTESDLAFIGLPPPEEGFQSVYTSYMKHLKSVKNIALVVAAEPVDFQEIFK